MSKRSEIVATAAILTVTWWMSLPEHQRREYLMGMLRTSAACTQTAARWFARQAMREELAGRPDDAGRLYRTAYRLMTGPYPRARALYDKTRNTHP